METGWKPLDVYQIHLMLFKYQTVTKTQFLQNINYLEKQNKVEPSLPNFVIDIIKDIFLRHDAGLYIKCKRAHALTEFADVLVELVDKIITINESNDTNNVDGVFLKNDFVQQFYGIIATYF
eukprot:272365_1